MDNMDMTNQGGCFGASFTGLYQLVYTAGDSGAQCVGDFGSMAEITPTSVIVNSCYTGSDTSEYLYSFFF